MYIDKVKFLREELVPIIRRIRPDTLPLFGKMSVQQFVEHFSGDAVRNASGKLKFDAPVTPAEHIPKMREFMLSEKPFKENTKNPLMAEDPPPLRFANLDEAADKLQKELDYFFTVYENGSITSIINPFFGELNFEQNVHLLYKHALHHLRQFGVSL